MIRVRDEGPGSPGALIRFLAAVLVVAACGGSSSTTASTIAPTASAATTLPAATTTVAPSTSTTTTTLVAVPLPTPFDPLGATIQEIQDAMEDGTITSVALVEFYLNRIAAYDDRGPSLNAVLTLDPNAREEAAALDAERRRQGPRSPLHGIPILLKDNIGTADMPTTAGTVALAGFVPVADAFQVARLRAAGAIILGKTNLHEFARDITTVSSLGGQTRNPFDPTRNPGGSSGGTGAAIAAEFATVGLGTDTCGSIRVPSAHNHLYGLRPTQGLSSRTGVMPLSFSEDTVGPMARSVADLAIVLDLTAGYDPDDPQSVVTNGSYLEAAVPTGLEGKRIGVLESLFADADPEVVREVRAALDLMEAHGAEVVNGDVPGLAGLRGSATSVFLREFRTAFDAYLAGQPEAPYASLAAIVATGLHHPSLDDRLSSALSATIDDAAYRDALRRREQVRGTVESFMEAHDLDALAYPAIRRPAAKIGQRQSGSNCATASLGGLPALVVPAGFTDAGLPVGLELLGSSFTEETLIAIAAGYEAQAPPRSLPPTAPPLFWADPWHPALP